MKTLAFLFALLVMGTGCDYREYPQEQEYREEFSDDTRDQKPVKDVERETDRDLNLEN